MDRISALRNVEEALSDLERGEVDLATAERRVVGVLRTYVTDLESEDGRAAYEAVGEEPADGVVVVAEDREAARERVRDLAAAEDAVFDLERVG